MVVFKSSNDNNGNSNFELLRVRLVVRVGYIKYVSLIYNKNVGKRCDSKKGKRYLRGGERIPIIVDDTELLTGFAIDYYNTLHKEWKIDTKYANSYYNLSKIKMAQKIL